MKQSTFAYLENLETPDEPQVDPIPDDIPLLELADQVVRGKVRLSQQQMRMLIEMLPFVAPKLTAVAHLTDADTFAVRLEKAVQRSDKVRNAQPKLIEDLRFRDE